MSNIFMIKLILWVTALTYSSISFSQSIKFSAFLNNSPLIFNTNIPFKDSFIHVEVFKMYISNIAFTYHDGSTYNEKDSYHLIDLANSNNDKLFITDSKERIKQLSFDIGIDSATNHQGAKGGDLDPLKGMYWTWQSGYIHFKIEGSSPLCRSSKNKFSFHIGGFQYPFNAIQHVVLQENSANDILVAIKLDDFFRSVRLDERTNVMSPGRKAMYIAEKFKHVFEIKND